MEKGRNCSLNYMLKKDWTETIEKIDEEVLYVVGGLYGNKFALDEIISMANKENAKIIFNGDMHWFDTKLEDFLLIEQMAKNYDKLLGNVEKELIQNNDVGCGCNYPLDVDKGIVKRSNEIHNMMKKSIENNKILNDISLRANTKAVAMNGLKIAITHGDEKNLAGWNCSIDSLQNKTRQDELENWFQKTDVDVLATTHTCLPALYLGGNGIVVNNGAAGMANTKEKTYGLITRIAKTKSNDTVVSQRYKDSYIELVKVNFNIDKFITWFDNRWSKGTPAQISYRDRIVAGTSLKVSDIVIRRQDDKKS